ncbi:SMP-30/gluconolactonase/LRE family protein [Nocardia sp. AG03]|uniref:SMP-30/gluconolactonase/LRE family protein n=1 Tax=Nocardia sp. AG03 TaxID=3025312 RepID=UPI0024183D9D|nr:SMP-30/gluconolactonase/LRE family protein [Nocardia sp. AG03]
MTGVTGALVLPGAATVSAAPQTCAPWTREVVADGFGALENLGFDGRGNVLLSEQDLGGGPGAVRVLGADGTRGTLADGVDGPGGIVVDGASAYFTTGNTATAALSGQSSGTIDAVDLETGVRSTVARGLTMPNGLTRLANGDFVVSRDIGGGSMTRVDTAGNTTPFATTLTSTNGLAFDAPRDRLIVSTTFDPTTVIAAVDPAGTPITRTELPGFGPLNSADDLTVAPDGTAYVALNVAGAVHQVDLDNGRSCRIADNLPLISSVRFGTGPGWDPNSLYATSFLGTVTKLSPPR